MDYEDLVKRLRMKQWSYEVTGNKNAGKIFAEAADAIEELLGKMKGDKNAED
jgi:hypothetical protein